MIEWRWTASMNPNTLQLWAGTALKALVLIPDALHEEGKYILRLSDGVAFTCKTEEEAQRRIAWYSYGTSPPIPSLSTYIDSRQRKVQRLSCVLAESRWVYHKNREVGFRLVEEIA